MNLLATVAIAAPVTGWLAYLDYGHGIRQLEQRLLDIERLVVPGVETPLRAADATRMQELALAILGLPGIRAVELRTTDGERPAVSVRVGAADASRSVTRETAVACGCDASGRILGTLRVEASLTDVDRMVLVRSLGLLAGTTGAAFLAGLFAARPRYRPRPPGFPARRRTEAAARPPPGRRVVSVSEAACPDAMREATDRERRAASGCGGGAAAESFRYPEDLTGGAGYGRDQLTSLPAAIPAFGATERTALDNQVAARPLADPEHRPRPSRRATAGTNRMSASHGPCSLGVIAGCIIHDLNNLLAAIEGFSRSLLEDSVPDTAAHRHALRILAAGRQGKALTAQAMTTGRGDRLSRRPVALADVIDDTAGLLCVLVPSSTRILAPGDGQQVVVSGDQYRLGQMLLNLCLNANDALEGRAGTIAMTIDDIDCASEAVQRLSERGDVRAIDTWLDEHGTAWAVLGRLDPAVPYASLRISDSGRGMSLDMLKVVFTPFFTTKAAQPSAGLGLAIAQSVVLHHDGAMIVASRPGQGTDIEVVLPQATGNERPAGTIDQSAAAAPMRGRVLLVDDAPAAGDMLLIDLERTGLEVAPCLDPRDAIEGIRTLPDAWDVLVANLTMTDGGGLDLIRAVKAIRPDLPCILCHSPDEAVEDRLLHEAGVLKMLAQPAQAGELAVIIGQAIRSAPTAGPVARSRGGNIPSDAAD